MSKPLLVIAMPVINGSAHIEEVAKGWLNLLDTFFAKDDITKLLLVDYGSTDNTLEVLKQLQSERSDKIEVSSSSSAGYNNGLISAYNNAVALNPEYVFQVNADVRYSPDEFHKIWERGQIGKIIIGSRRNTKENKGSLKWLIKMMYGVIIKDASIPYRLYQTDYLKHLLNLLPSSLPANPNTYFSLLAKYSGEGLHNVPISYRANNILGEGCVLTYADIMANRSDVKRNADKLLDLVEAS